MREFKLFKDRDFVEDKDGYMFCVVGYVHPPDRVLAYLKYIPSGEKTIWYRKNVGFRRILKYYSSVAVLNSMKLLSEIKPNYIYYDNYFKIKFVGVPKGEIKKHYIPEEKLEEIINKQSRDPLEQDLVELVNYLSEISGIDLKYFGISGSILLNIHNPKYSDIDLMIYGRDNSFKLLSIIDQVINEGVISLPDRRMLKTWSYEVSKHHPLTLKEAMRLYVERKTRLIFKGKRIFSLHPARLDNEILENYGDRVYIPMCLVKIKGKVKDDSDSLFLPATYIVDDVKIIEGDFEGEIREVTTFEGLYSALLKKGEEFIAYGKVEKVVETKTGKTHYRLVVGSAEAKGKDYIKPIRWIKEAELIG